MHEFIIADLHAVANPTSVGRRYGMGGTKAPFVNFSLSSIFYLTKVIVRFVESHSYLTSVPTAELRWHLSNINAIFSR